MENKKRERGANYTAEEKTLLADLITQYKHIIENKRTGAEYLSKKKKAWIEITRKYNSNCTTGNRGTDQLKSLYDNMKQKTRKNVGESNKTEYLKTQTPLAHTQLIENGVTEADLKRALENLKEDKVQMNKTGGGFWKPKVTESDDKILALIEDQVKPLPNPYDSGAVYFKDDTAINQVELVKVSSDFGYLVQGSTLGDSSTADIAIETDNCQPLYNDHIPSPTMDVEHVRSDQDEIRTTPSRVLLKNKEAATVNIRTTPSRVLTPHQKVLKNKEAATVQKKLKRGSSAAAFKRTFFKIKCQNAGLERKKLMQDIMHLKLQNQREQQQHNLKMTILNEQLEKIRSS